ncbi:MAG: hypothetical protein COX16_15155 [Deltaproteobacteria bacterium CG23_combo_of_CG06-09_8_20_14_all_51_20]|nr:MAG: hypothetical protein COX16_15155 [Deltaproteobacteria bacterium CG23_combo_of_CG06-09_8_20_14_all_51_20]PIW01653.1 MAG: hypothetical protein COW41_02000 [Deltaproteobacteria bacterium CG17_big_fil_post_rev_8_21_14_2_50_51_6]
MGGSSWNRLYSINLVRKTEKRKKGKKGKREYIVKQCGKCLFQLDPLTQNALYKPVTGFFRACSMLDPA